MDIRVYKTTGNHFPRSLKMNPTNKNLYYAGDFSLLKTTDIISVTGSRHMRNSDAENAFEIGRRLAEDGYVMMNGLSIGCDSCAASGFLNNNGKMIAVLPCGFHNISRNVNEIFIDQVLENGGLLISQCSPTTSAQRIDFLNTGVIEARLCRKMIVIHSRMRGSTMYAAKEAWAADKELGCIGSSEGNDYLMKTGKAEKLMSPEDAIDWIAAGASSYNIYKKSPGHDQRH